MKQRFLNEMHLKFEDQAIDVAKTAPDIWSGILGHVSCILKLLKEQFEDI